MTFVATKLFHKAGEGSGGGGGGGDQHNLGWYATESALTTAHATATDGDWAIVGATDTVWVWDTDTSAWVDTDTKGQVTSVNGQTGAVTIGANDVLPTQTGHSGHVLGTDGFVAGWVEPEIVQRAVLPVASQDEEGNIYQFVGTTDANYTNGYFYKCVSDGQTPATYSWQNIEVQEADALPDQTGNSGKFLTTDGTDASWSDKPLVNKSLNGKLVITTGTNSVSNAPFSITYDNIASPKVSSNYCQMLIGSFNTAATSLSGWGATMIGVDTQATGTCALAIGPMTQAKANGAIQLGSTGTQTPNSDANTFKVANLNGNFEMMSADGTIPTARLTKVNTTVTLASADWSGGSQTVTVTGMTTTGVVLVSPDPTDQSAYTSAGILCTAQAADSLTFTATTTPTGDIDVNVVCL